jgi:hypothetical protein
MRRLRSGSKLVLGDCQRGCSLREVTIHDVLSAEINLATFSSVLVMEN